MKLTPLLEECQKGTCPTVYVSDRGTLVFQGIPVGEADGMVLGLGERAVELPANLVKEALLAFER
jgi:hypothetical protein